MVRGKRRSVGNTDRSAEQPQEPAGVGGLTGVLGGVVKVWLKRSWHLGRALMNISRVVILSDDTLTSHRWDLGVAGKLLLLGAWRI